MAKMTERQKKFCDEYLVDLSAKHAAIRAGYSAKTAAEIAYEMLRKPCIEEYIATRMAQLQGKCVASIDEVLQYLTSVMRGDGTEEVTVVESSGVGFSSARNIEKALAPKDRIKAAELIGKRYGMFNFDDKRLELEKQRLDLEYLKVEATQQVNQTETASTNFIDALNETSETVWPKSEDENE